ncbi:hypothetical protein TSUD_330870 [Trifolium subterraneum]|nr:hypothetical protein TSUD_330870 [Trifolium subterraneum]
MSGLKVNFSKSMFVGVNISETWLHAAATALRCKMGKISFIYLGLSIGGDPRRLSFWEPVLNCIQNRLSGWRSRFISFGGRLILLKSVLTYLPVYALSFFKASLAHYGIDRGGRSGSSWWREIARIRDGVADIGGGWFGESVVRKVGDGVETFFWTDPWLDGIPLCERFQRLFDLSVNKSSTVAGCFSLGWGIGGEAWVWRRQLWAWEEEMVEECQALLHNFVLQDQSVDMWLWRPNPIRGYSVLGEYQLLTSHQRIPLIDTEDLIWHKQEVHEHDAHSCSLFGSYASGQFGKKEITGYSETPNSPYLS